jgi:serine/threonine protein kinase
MALHARSTSLGISESPEYRADLRSRGSRLDNGVGRSETLKGPLPLDTALNYAGQIADALEAAHEKGIVHRDLKPATIKVTPQGVLKILDFGLAKAAEEPVGNSENSTLTISPTRAGLILGTAAYMSPEQARGKPVDKRADIWAFGLVLYEVLTGQRLFKDDTISDTLAAVLKEEPDLEQVLKREGTMLNDKKLQAFASRINELGLGDHRKELRAINDIPTWNSSRADQLKKLREAIGQNFLAAHKNGPTANNLDLAMHLTHVAPIGSIKTHGGLPPQSGRT